LRAILLFLDVYPQRLLVFKVACLLFLSWGFDFVFLVNGMKKGMLEKFWYCGYFSHVHSPEMGGQVIFNALNSS